MVSKLASLSLQHSHPDTHAHGCMERTLQQDPNRTAPGGTWCVKKASEGWILEKRNDLYLLRQEIHSIPKVRRPQRRHWYLLVVLSLSSHTESAEMKGHPPPHPWNTIHAAVPSVPGGVLLCRLTPKYPEGPFLWNRTEP